MKLLKKVILFFIILIGFTLFNYVFFYATDIYPADCSFMVGPLVDKCLEKNREIGAINRIDGRPYTTTFIVKVPDYTSSMDKIYLESSNGIFQMENVELNTWKVNITGSGQMNYRYTRNNLGYLGSEKFIIDSDKSYRMINLTYKPKLQVDYVEEWRYFSNRQLYDVPSLASVTPIYKRDFIRGISMENYWKSNFPDYLDETNLRIKNDNANWVMLTASNSYEVSEPLPKINKINNNSLDVLQKQIESAKRNGLKIILKIRLCCNNPPPQLRSDEWWDAWFSEVDEVMKFYSEFADENGIGKILIDYSYWASFPGDFYSYDPAKLKWMKLINDTKERYSGELGVNTFIKQSFNDILIPYPNSAKNYDLYLDFYGLEIWTALGNRSDLTQEELYKNSEIALNHLALAMKSYKKPIIISGLAYGCFDGAAQKSIENNLKGIYPWESANPELIFDPYEQAMIYEAYLKNIANRSQIQGVFSYGFSHLGLPDTLDYSIRGKEAEQILKKWYAVY